jgi:hypothetical protein
MTCAFDAMLETLAELKGRDPTSASSRSGQSNSGYPLSTKPRIFPKTDF